MLWGNTDPFHDLRANVDIYFRQNMLLIGTPFNSDCPHVRVSVPQKLLVEIVQEIVIFAIDR